MHSKFTVLGHLYITEHLVLALQVQKWYIPHALMPADAVTTVIPAAQMAPKQLKEEDILVGELIFFNAALFYIQEHLLNLKIYNIYKSILKVQNRYSTHSTL